MPIFDRNDTPQRSGTATELASYVPERGELVFVEGEGMKLGDGWRQVSTLPFLGSATASATSFTPAGNIAATNVQAALAELDAEKPSANDPFGWGFPFTFPMLSGNQTAGSVLGNGWAWFTRAIGGGTISKVGLRVGAQSGNVCVGVYRPSGGTGRSITGLTRIATSGSVACPAVGYQEIALTASVAVQPGDFFALSCDNTTATFRMVAGSDSSNLHVGVAYLDSSGTFPLVATPGIAAAADRQFILVGVA